MLVRSLQIERSGPGEIFALLQHEGFQQAARTIFGAPHVRPFSVYANVTWQLPFDQGAGHTDVPEFRGINRTEHPTTFLSLLGPSRPLAPDRTSVGIVADAKLHPFTSLNTFEKALHWLDVHEPQYAASVRASRGDQLDFLALRNYSHDVRQMFSERRWCLTGDAGVFLDPLYSPGSDFIAMANTFASDLVRRDLAGEPLEAMAKAWDTSYRSLARTYLATYQRQYPLMGHPRVMTTKVVWDFVMYWGGVALLFSRDKLTDAGFMARARPLLQAFA